jgi:hypothetical protein
LIEPKPHITDESDTPIRTSFGDVSDKFRIDFVRVATTDVTEHWLRKRGQIVRDASLRVERLSIEFRVRRTVHIKRVRIVFSASDPQQLAAREDDIRLFARLLFVLVN